MSAKKKTLIQLVVELIILIAGLFLFPVLVGPALGCDYWDGMLLLIGLNFALDAGHRSADRRRNES